MRRDVRVDRIGFVTELAKRYVDEHVKPAVKGSMKPGETVQGDFYEATLYAGGTASDKEAVEPERLIALYENGQITKAELAKCITVDPAQVKLCGGLTVKQITNLVKVTKGGKLADRFVVGRLAGIDVTPAAAALGLHEALAVGLKAAA